MDTVQVVSGSERHLNYKTKRTPKQGVVSGRGVEMKMEKKGQTWEVIVRNVSLMKKQDSGGSAVKLG